MDMSWLCITAVRFASHASTVSYSVCLITARRARAHAPGLRDVSVAAATAAAWRQSWRPWLQRAGVNRVESRRTARARARTRARRWAAPAAEMRSERWGPGHGRGGAGRERSGAE